MQGVWIKDARVPRFSDYPLALSDEWNELWWMIGLQSGPISSEWLWQSPENEAFAEGAFAFHVDNQLFNSVYRHNTIRTLAPHIVLDEWSYFCGFSAPDEQMARDVAARFRRCDSLDDVLLVTEKEAVDVVIFDVDDSLLFVWSPHQDWLDAFSFRSTNWLTIDSHIKWW